MEPAMIKALEVGGGDWEVNAVYVLTFKGEGGAPMAVDLLEF